MVATIGSGWECQNFAFLFESKCIACTEIDKWWLNCHIDGEDGNYAKASSSIEISSTHMEQYCFLNIKRMLSRRSEDEHIFVFIAFALFRENPLSWTSFYPVLYFKRQKTLSIVGTIAS